jgi:demethylmenaquinone methyltransferase / 2-methoxy-6-polyprenyl-1,4-benzoquinol methylase
MAASSLSVRDMFERIAPRYDVMNRLMTAGLDRRWRQMALGEAALPPGGRLLDLATGTGDIALMALAGDAALQVTGADFSLAMMRIGQRRLHGDRVGWCGADAVRLPFADHTFDSLISAYLLRNLPPARLLDGLREQARIVKPGGRVVCLDATPPRPGLLLPLIRFYLDRVIPVIGTLLTGQPDAYAYLARTAQAFKTGQEIAVLMESAGLQDTRCRTFVFGAMSLVVGRKPA